MKIKTIKAKYVTRQMIKDASNNKINFEIDADDVTYVLYGGMVTKIEGNEVSLIQGNSFKICEELSL